MPPAVSNAFRFTFDGHHHDKSSERSVNHYHRFSDWLFRFASSQENIDRVAVRLTWLTVVLIAITIALFLRYLTSR